MADAYERVKGGRLAFKGGGLATLSKPIDKKKKNKKKKSKNKESDVAITGEDGVEILEGEDALVAGDAGQGSDPAGGEDIYTIDAAKRMKYDQLFPVEAKKFGYQPKATFTNVEEALDDRVKKKADRYCK